MVRVMGHMSSSGSASRSASGALGGSPGALAEHRVRTPELAFPDAGCDTADVLRRFEGAIERTPGVVASPALGTLRIYRNSGVSSFRHGTKWELATRLSCEVVKPIDCVLVGRNEMHIIPNYIFALVVATESACVYVSSSFVATEVTVSRLLLRAPSRPRNI